MGGTPYSKDKLNRTLKAISELLHQNGIKKWFISYGTLLGIVREDSCIEGDDDVDIILSMEYYDKIRKILPSLFIHKLQCMIPNLIKTNLKHPYYSSIDFYFSKIDSSGNFHDSLNGVIWSECYVDGNEFIKKEWNGTILHLPNNYEQKLVNRYGDNWMTPQKSKGRNPHLKKI